MIRQKTQERRRAVIISGAMFLVVAGAAIATFMSSSPNKQMKTPVASDDFRGAIITEDSDGSGCSQQVFDNRTGRVIMSKRSCATTTYDSNGVPIPTGTIHRLDAISRSFHSP
jgi:hypothetical protein